MKIRSMTIILFAAVTLSCSTSEISVQKDALRQIKTVAVIPFAVAKGVSGKAGQESTDAFASHMIRAGFRVVERQALDKILKEKELAMSGLTAGKSIELGQLLAADGLLEGRITRHDMETVDGNIELSAYGPDAYKPENDPKDGTYFQKNGTWFRKARLKVFRFQVLVRLMSAKDGGVVFTLQNANPEMRYEVDAFGTPLDIDDFRNRVLQQRGEDLVKALKR